jgi:hypothetical protein
VVHDFDGPKTTDASAQGRDIETSVSRVLGLSTCRRTRASCIEERTPREGCSRTSLGQTDHRRGLFGVRLMCKT